MSYFVSTTMELERDDEFFELEVSGEYSPGFRGKMPSLSDEIGEEPYGPEVEITSVMCDGKIFNTTSAEEEMIIDKLIKEAEAGYDDRYDGY